jgi:L-iditol 2-dehydrogenase
MVSSSNAINTAAVLHGAGDLRLQQRTPQAPQPGHAQVRIMSTTLCGSDRMYFETLFPTLEVPKRHLASHIQGD